MARDHVETFVYLLRDEVGEVLYVGVTDNPRRRFRQHAATKEWWPLVQSRRLLSLPDRPSALLWESALIDALLPQFNLTGEGHRERKQDLHECIQVMADLLGMPA